MAKGTINKSLIKEINEVLKETEQEMGNSIYPSRGLKCLRRETLKLMGIVGASKEVSPELSLYSEMGKSVHKLVLEKLRKESGVKLLYSEYKLPKLDNAGLVTKDMVLRLSGRCDGIIYWGGKVYVLELKTTSGNSLPDGIKREHQEQSRIYSAVTGFPVIVAYISREPGMYDPDNPLHSISYIMNYDEQESYEVFRKLYTINQYVDHYKLHPKFVVPVKGLCNHCSFFSYCYGDDEILIKGVESSLYDDYQFEEQAKLSAGLAISNTNKRKKFLLKFFTIYGNGNFLKRLNWRDL